MTVNRPVDLKIGQTYAVRVDNDGAELSFTAKLTKIKVAQEHTMWGTEVEFDNGVTADCGALWLEEVSDP